jgi:magnesium-transporting ATPase (P-type)
MSSEPQQWLFIFLFFLGFFVFTIAESFWLYKKNGISPGRAFGFSFASNIFTITVGFFLSSVVFVALLAMSRGESLAVTPDNTMVAAAFVLSFIIPILVLVLAKMLLLRFLKITSVERPLVYSLVAAVGFFIAVLLLPFLAEYLRAR